MHAEHRSCNATGGRGDLEHRQARSHTSPPLQPLLANTNLKDLSTHPGFTNDGLQGTFGRGSPKEKFDYLLLSPPYLRKVTGGAVFRKGVWGENKNPPTKWQIYPTITQPVHAASDHAAIYADIDL